MIAIADTYKRLRCQRQNNRHLVHIKYLFSWQCIRSTYIIQYIVVLLCPSFSVSRKERICQNEYVYADAVLHKNLNEDNNAFLYCLHYFTFQQCIH